MHAARLSFFSIKIAETYCDFFGLVMWLSHFSHYDFFSKTHEKYDTKYSRLDLVKFVEGNP